MKSYPMLKPLVLGAMMGLMMLAMAHMVLTGDSARGAVALAAFVGAHVLVLLGLAGLGLWAAHFAPRFRARLSRLHRPTRHHVIPMLAGAMLAVALSHLYLHGGL